MGFSFSKTSEVNLFMLQKEKLRLQGILPDGENYEPWKGRIREIVEDFRINDTLQVSNNVSNFAVWYRVEGVVKGARLSLPVKATNGTNF